MKGRAPGGASKLCSCFRPAHFSRLLGRVDAGLVFKQEEEQEVVQVMDAHRTQYHLYNIMQSVQQTARNKQCVREGFTDDTSWQFVSLFMLHDERPLKVPKHKASQERKGGASSAVTPVGRGVEWIHV